MLQRRSPRPTLSALVIAGSVLVGGVLLTGCGDPQDNPLGLPSLGAVAATTSPGRTPGASASAGAAAPTVAASGPGAQDAVGTGGATAELGRLTGTARSRPDVVRAVVDYMAVRVQIANTWQVDAGALAEVATGQAAASARQRATAMQAKQLRAVGSYVVNASRVRVTGDRAVVTGCMVDRTSEVDALGQALVGPPGGRRVTMRLQRDSGRWLVSNVPVAVPPFCRATS